MRTNVKNRLANHNKTFINEKVKPHIFAELIFKGYRKDKLGREKFHKVWDVNYNDGTTKRVSMAYQVGVWTYEVISEEGE